MEFIKMWAMLLLTIYYSNGTVFHDIAGKLMEQSVCHELAEKGNTNPPPETLKYMKLWNISRAVYECKDVGEGD
jgi:hypothetical protein